MNMKPEKILGNGLYRAQKQTKYVLNYTDY